MWINYSVYPVPSRLPLRVIRALSALLILQGRFPLAVYFTHGGVCIWTCQSLSCVQLFASPWTVACQAPLSMGFSRQEYWSRLPFPSPGNLPNPGIKSGSPLLQADSLLSKPPRKPPQTYFFLTCVAAVDIYLPYIKLHSCSELSSRSVSHFKIKSLETRLNSWP